MANAERRKIVVMEDHDDVYYYWKTHNVSGAKIVHIDPHCDLYGALVNLSDQYLVQTRNDIINEGNWLVFAVKEGMVNSINWVFDEYGDRRYDVHTVKHETDLSERWPTAKARNKKAEKTPIRFSKTKYEDWQGFEPGEHLSLDWDFFSFVFKDESKIGESCETFLKRDMKSPPDVTYICYSHDYIHGSCVKFINFINGLAKKFDADIEYFEPVKDRPPIPDPSLPRKVWDKAYTKLGIWMRQRGIY